MPVEYDVVTILLTSHVLVTNKSSIDNNKV